MLELREGPEGDDTRYGEECAFHCIRGWRNLYFQLDSDLTRADYQSKDRLRRVH